MTANKRTKEIILGDDFGDVTVSANCARIAIGADGTVKLCPPANDSSLPATRDQARIAIGADGTVKLCPPANDSSLPATRDQYEIGRHIEGKGVFVGTWTPMDRDGNSLGKTFNLFAAPVDIGVLKTFNTAVAYVAYLENWHGHDGFDHDVGGKTADNALYDALRDGTYNGEWFIPPKDVLGDNLYENKDKFKPKNAFVTTSVTTSNGSGYVHWYWSCTEHARISSHAWLLRFTGGVGDWALKCGDELSVRCVRAEPAAP